MPRALALALALVVPALALACGGTEALSIEVTFAEAAVRDATATVELALRAGDCEGGEVLWRQLVRSGEQPTERPMTLADWDRIAPEAVGVASGRGTSGS